MSEMADCSLTGLLRAQAKDYEAELVALRARSEWRPIETAPKDGTDVLVYCGPDDDPMWGIASWDEDAGWVMWWDTGMKGHTWPSYWIPLPASPLR
jgi:hypothetical protein